MQHAEQVTSVSSHPLQSGSVCIAPSARHADGISGCKTLESFCTAALRLVNSGFAEKALMPLQMAHQSLLIGPVLSLNAQNRCELILFYPKPGISNMPS